VLCVCMYICFCVCACVCEVCVFVRCVCIMPWMTLLATLSRWIFYLFFILIFFLHYSPAGE